MQAKSPGRDMQVDPIRRSAMLRPATRPACRRRARRSWSVVRVRAGRSWPGSGVLLHRRIADKAAGAGLAIELVGEIGPRSRRAPLPWRAARAGQTLHGVVDDTMISGNRPDARPDVGAYIWALTGSTLAREVGALRRSQMPLGCGGVTCAHRIGDRAVADPIVAAADLRWSCRCTFIFSSRGIAKKSIARWRRLSMMRSADTPSP